VVHSIQFLRISYDFLGEEEALPSWIKEKMTLWTTAIHEIAYVLKNFPQSVYAGLQKSLQQEWQFIQRVVKESGGSFIGIEETLSKAFLPSLFDNDLRRKLTTLLVKFSGLAIPDPAVRSKKRPSSSKYNS
jgi:hypothetical protein